MATTNIELDIENITGVADANDQFIVSAQKSIVVSIPKELMWQYASTYTSVGSSGQALNGDTVLDVSLVTGQVAERVSASLAYDITDSSSLYKATTRYPKYYIKDGKVYIAPTPSDDGIVSYINYSNIDDDSDLRSAVVFHASSKEFTKLATDGLPSWTSPTAPISPSSPDFGSDLSISSSSPVVPTITASTVDTSGWSSPVYIKPVLSLTANPNITDLNIDSVLPISPESPSFDTGDISVSSSAPTYSKPVLSLSTLSSISDLSISLSPPVPPVIASTTSGGIVVDSELLSSAPIYLSPVMEGRTSFINYTSGLSELDPGILSISATSPVSPTSPSFTTPDVSSVTVSNLGSPPTYTKPTVQGGSDELTDVTSGTIGGAETDFDEWFHVAGQFIEDEEDTELAAAQIQKISTYISAYSQEMQNQLNVFNDANAEYQVKLQEAIQQAQINAQEAQQEANLKLQKEQQEYGSELQKFQAEVGKYQADVAREIQEYTQKLAQYQVELTTSLQSWQKEETDKVSRYQSEVQNNLNEFNEETAEYQATLQIALKNADLASAGDGLMIQKFSSELGSYQQQVNKDIQQFTNNFQKNIQIYQAENQAKLSEYQSNIQNELNEFNKELQIYQAEVQSSIQDAQLESAEEGQKIQKYSAELNGYQQDINKEVQDFVNTLNKEVQEHQSKISLYSADIQKYQTDIAEKTQESYVSTQNVQYYEKQSDKYYNWALGEVQQYIQNNSKMINKTIAAQAAQQQ
jgi:hypothetical protein